MLRKLFQNQYLPTIEDVKNEEAGKLAKRLKSSSDKETLTNMLEWEERNVQQWIDRWYMFVILYLLLVASFYFLPITGSIKSFIIFIFILLALFNITQFLSYFIPLLSYLIALSAWAISINPNAEKIFPLNQLIPLSVIFGGLLFLFLYLILKYRGLKSRYPDFKLEDTFKLSLSVDKIIKYRLAICRDYAKLTATLLLKLYPENKIYFLLIPHHVAAGIEINGKIYILDQRLPISTSTKWLNYWKNRMKKEKIKPDLFEISINEESIKLNSVEFPETIQEKSSKKDTDKLTNDAAKILNIEQKSRRKEPDFTTTLKKYSMLYENDEISKFSLVRAIKNKLIDEFCENSNKISKIDITIDKEDLILKVYTKTSL
jgi:predicted transglutaminase-like protease